MAARVIVCIHRLTKNGMRQLCHGQARCFSRSSRFAVAGEHDATSQDSQQYTEERRQASTKTQTPWNRRSMTQGRESYRPLYLLFTSMAGLGEQLLQVQKQKVFLPSHTACFPRGGAELVHFFYASSNQQLAAILADRVQQQGEEKPKTREFISDALETRLRMIVPYIDTWPQAMAIQTLPQNVLESWTNLQNLVDDIWYYAGDRSVDFNWYTKRVSLAGVYKSTEIFMLQDRSEDNMDTWAFMGRRLQDIQTLGKAARNASQMSTVMTEGLWGMCIMGRNILGMNPRNR